MKNNFFILFLFCIMMLPANAAIEGGVTKTGAASSVVDLQTKQPVEGATVSLPTLKFSTKTDANGAFDLNQKVSGPTIISVEKDGYRPYSLTIDEQIAAKPIIMGIEKNNAHDIVLDTEMFHLGDDSFSPTSANSGEFRGAAIGPFYSKIFKLTAEALTRTNYLVIGSIIGIDTKMAQEMGQNKVKYSYASPPEVYFNGNKIAEIHINGDGQKIKLPNNLIKVNGNNEITIKTGRNMSQTAYVDYDDIELANLSIQSE